MKKIGMLHLNPVEWPLIYIAWILYPHIWLNCSLYSIHSTEQWEVALVVPIGRTSRSPVFIENDTLECICSCLSWDSETNYFTRNALFGTMFARVFCSSTEGLIEHFTMVEDLSHHSKNASGWPSRHLITLWETYSKVKQWDIVYTLYSVSFSIFHLEVSRHNYLLIKLRWEQSFDLQAVGNLQFIIKMWMRGNRTQLSHVPSKDYELFAY